MPHFGQNMKGMMCAN